MVDTQQLQLASPITRAVAAVAGRLAEHSALVSPLQVATYLPLDVDSVSRILDTLKNEYDFERVERDGICYFHIEAPEPLLEKGGSIDLEMAFDLWEIEGLKEQLDELKADDDWACKVREQHDLLVVAAQADERHVELSYVLKRSDLTSAKIQSIFNDFEVEGYVEYCFENDDEALEYRLPDFKYTDDRHRRNLSRLEALDGTRKRYRLWLVVGLCAVVLLACIILFQQL